MADPWYGAPVSEFTTPSDVRRARGMHDLGWDIDAPWRELARQFFTYLGMVPGRSPIGPRTMVDTGLAMRAPSSITGGWPTQFGLPSSRYAPIANSSTGLVSRNPQAFHQEGASLQLRQDMRGAGITPDDFGFVGPSAPANMNSRMWLVR